MAKSMRSKREKRLRAIRREMVEPLYEQRDAAKLAVQAAALAAPKLPVRTYSKGTTTTTSSSSSVDVATLSSTSNSAAMDVEMVDNSTAMGHLKPVGGVGKKLKKKLKLGKGKRHGKGKGKGKGKIRRKHI